MEKYQTHQAGDPRLAVQSADAFRMLAESFLDVVDSDRDPETGLQSSIPGSAGASATNMALALELYLKTALLALGTKVPRTHNLLQLFNLLPDDLRGEIAARYDAHPSPAGTARSMLIELSDEHLPDEPASAPSEQQQDVSLSAILERSQDAFTIWRYLYQSGGKPGVFEYEHYALGLVCEILGDVMRPVLRSDLPDGFWPPVSNKRIERTP
jgi:hypothetical protein